MGKLLSIIIPSFNDPRIERAIKSVNAFDDLGVVKIIVVDSGSTPEVQKSIKDNLRLSDIFISEKDEGIFDGFNKGLNLVDTIYTGWVGSDDLFTGEVMASEVVSALENYDLFVTSVFFFDGDSVTRKTPSWPSRFGLMRFGLHNPHFGTFGRSKLLKSEFFNLLYKASDIDYFIKIFNKSPKILTSSKVSVLQAEGGFSNRSLGGIIKLNFECIDIFSSYYYMATLAVINKVLIKAIYKLYYKLNKTKIDHLINRIKNRHNELPTF